MCFDASELECAWVFFSFYSVAEQTPALRWICSSMCWDSLIDQTSVDLVF